MAALIDLSRRSLLAGAAALSACGPAKPPTGDPSGVTLRVATFKGGNPDAGTVSWSFYGSPQ